MLSLVSIVASLVAVAHAQSYSATYLPSNAPDHSEQGQAGTNKCGNGQSQNSTCQNAYINSVDDFCLFAPPEPGPTSTIGDSERIEVSWCIKGGYGTRIIPDGAITGAHFVKTPDFVQITGVGDLTKLNIPKGDSGGELDPHGADGNGNPIGGLVFSSAFGDLQQLHEWTNYMSDSMFCFRACKEGPQAPTFCQHVYDVMGCQWNMPANYNAGTFERCVGDSGEPMGVYGGSTFHQGQPATPDAHPAPSSSQCTTLSTIGNGLAASSTSAAANATTTSSGSSSGSSGSSSPSKDTTSSPSGTASPGSSLTSTTAAQSTGGSSSGASQTSTGGQPANTGASQNNAASAVDAKFGVYLTILAASALGAILMA
ncbi:hypothetical protein EIP91_006436 [Steccherinum ochraceum]|uniref:Uncharacterized protein n=1 Tax=Steccherinum ochraceum TaxID=92696 RepID=A0A4R0RKC5_9APHY|nr:hypothetical protein EIP91_006436 [Steccherinum ochraceum]